MALNRSERNALRAAKGQATRGKVSSAPTSATGVTGKTYTANQPEKIIEVQENEMTPVGEQRYDPTQDIQAMSEARKKAQLAGLQTKLQQAQSGIQQRRTELPQEYGEQRRQASVQSKLGAKSFSEFLAQRGLARSGEAGQARLMQNMALQGQLGGIGRQQQSELDRLSRQEQQLQQQYQSDVGLANAGVDADMMNQLIAARTRQADIGRQDLLRQEDLSREDILRQQGLSREDMLRDEQLRLRAEEIARQQAIREQDLMREQERYQSETQFRNQEAERDYDIALQRLGIDTRGMDIREKEALFNENYRGRQLEEEMRQAKASEELKRRGLDLESRELDLESRGLDIKGSTSRDKETTTKYKLNDSDKAVYKNLVEGSSDEITGLINKNTAITKIKSLIDEGYNMDAVEKMAEQLGISESDITSYVNSQQSQKQFNPSLGQFPLRIN